MVYEEILIGLVSGVIVLLALIWRRLSRLESQTNTAAAQRMERDLTSVGSEVALLGTRVSDLVDAAQTALVDYETLRKNMAVSTERSLASFKETLAENLEEVHRLARAAEDASERVRGAADAMEKRLTKAVEKQVGGTVTHRLEPLLDTLDKMTNRLEARGPPLSRRLRLRFSSA